MLVSSNKFTYDRESKTMSADITDIGSDAVWEQAYPDACDAGFRILSERTGKSVMFVVHEEKWNDGDLLYWKLKAVKDPRNHLPVLDHLTVIVFND